MGGLHDGLQALLDTFPGDKLERGAPVNDAQPSTCASLYRWLRSHKIAVLGEPDTAFAVYDEVLGQVRVYCREQQRVDIVSEQSLMFNVLNDVLSAGANFMRSGEDVFCVLDGEIVRGDSYVDAAMRAFSKRMGAQP